MIKKIALIAAALLLAAMPLVAHPHFMKTVEVSVGRDGPAAKVQHFTYPYNEAHLADVQSGFVFNVGNATFSVTQGSLKASDTVLEAGDYGLRAKANGSEDWTLLLIPFPAGADRQNPDMSTAIELPSVTHKTDVTAHHLGVDIHGGHGDTDGKVLVSVSFGPYIVDGILGL